MTLLQETKAAIEELAPDAGFWMKGKALDFTLEDVLSALLTPEARADDTDYCQMCGQGNLDHITFTLCRDKWELGKPLSEQSEETITFLHSLLCPPKR